MNGQPILLQDYERELARYELGQAELGLTPEPAGGGYRPEVLNALIDRELMRQAAAVQGISITADEVEQRIDRVRESAQESGGLDSWLNDNSYSLEEFSHALAGEMLVEALVEVITADVPQASEQVHARYLQVDDPALGASLLERLNAGEDFSQLAAQYSRDQVTASSGGDLGFFARGSLLVPEVEEAAFALPVGEYSDLIAVTGASDGRTIYYLIQVIDRDPERLLNTDLRYRLLQERFDEWLAVQREQAIITPLFDQ